MTPQLEEIIIGGPTESKILAEAKRQGMITMFEDGVLKVLEGTIGFEELIQVINVAAEEPKA
jgi:type II secretory ATPase GspE/PulE/Tfp pilus assembly ATPase PilB-like protein